MQFFSFQEIVSQEAGFKSFSPSSKGAVQILSGYHCNYFEKRWGRLKIIESKPREIIYPYWKTAQFIDDGWDFGIQGKTVLTLKYHNSEIERDIADTVSPNNTPFIDFRTVDENESRWLSRHYFPLYLIHNDIIPTFEEDIDLKAQVCLIASDPSYLEPTELDRIDTEAVSKLEAPHAREYLSPSVKTVAKIMNYEFILETQETHPLVSVVVETTLGLLEIVHRLDKIPDEDTSKIKIGNFIKTSGWLIGDAAVDEYAEGVVWTNQNTERYFWRNLKQNRCHLIRAILANDWYLEFPDSTKTSKLKEMEKALEDLCSARSPFIDLNSESMRDFIEVSIENARVKRITLRDPGK